MFCVHVYAESWSQTVSCIGWGKEQQFGEKRLQSKRSPFLRAAPSRWLGWIFKCSSSDAVWCLVSDCDCPITCFLKDAVCVSCLYLNSSILIRVPEDKYNLRNRGSRMTNLGFHQTWHYKYIFTRLRIFNHTQSFPLLRPEYFINYINMKETNVK